jgi:CRP-like cAMP-binding protein
MRHVQRSSINKLAPILSALGPDLRIENAQQGEIIYHQGDVANYLFVLLTGQLRFYATALNGKEATVSIVSAVDIFGEKALEQDSTRSVSAIAISPVELVRIDSETACRLVNNHAPTRIYLLSRLISRIAAYEETLINCLVDNSERRLVRALLLLSGSDLNPRVTNSIQGVSQSVLAEMVGTTRPRVNQFMSKFRRLGLIEYDGNKLYIKPQIVSVLTKDPDQR